MDKQLSAQYGQNAALSSEVALLTGLLSQTLEEKTRLTQENSKLAEEIAMLAYKNSEFRGGLGKNSSNTDKPPSSDHFHEPKPKPKSRRRSWAKSREPKRGTSAIGLGCQTSPGTRLAIPQAMRTMTNWERDYCNDNKKRSVHEQDPSIYRQ